LIYYDIVLYKFHVIKLNYKFKNLW